MATLFAGRSDTFCPPRIRYLGPTRASKLAGSMAMLRARRVERSDTAGPAGGVTSLLLNGASSVGGVACLPGQICTINGNSSANYSNWQIHGRAAGDYRLGAVWFTPSLAVFGGEAHNNQSTTSVLSLSQLADPARISTYNASTSLRWTDVGARAGMDLKFDVSPWAAIGIGGLAGSPRAGRRCQDPTSMSIIFLGFITAPAPYPASAGARRPSSPTPKRGSPSNRYRL